MIERFTYDDGRREYLTAGDEGYELVTSVTTAMPKPPAHILEDWKDRVGHEYADLNTKSAILLGNRLHDSMTRAYHGESYEGHIFEKFLDEVDYAIGNEVEVVSLSLKIAGTFDFIVMNRQGEVELIDFKNHSRVWPPKMVEKELLTLDQSIQSAKKTKWRKQGACYAQAIEETFGIKVARFSIWCYNQGDGKVTRPVTMSRKKIESVINKLPEQLLV